MTPVQKIQIAFNEMHREGALRECASTTILLNTFQVNGLDARLSIIGAISSMGGTHAPLVRTHLLLQEALKIDPSKLKIFIQNFNKKHRIPGFGSSFVKGEPDPIHSNIDALIKEYSPKIHFYMVEMLNLVHEFISPKLYFNTAMYSAAVGEILNISPYVLPGKAIEARIPVWNMVMQEFINKKLKS